MQAEKNFEGVFPIVATVFDETGRLDMKGQLQLVDYLLQEGAHGLGLFGIASEGYALTAEERMQLQRAIVKHVNGRVPLIVSSSFTGALAAAEMSRSVEGEGADALMVLPPHLLKPDGEGLFHYYATIGDAVSIPIMVQDAPLMTQITMPPALLARMAREIPRVTMAKVEAPATAPKITQVVAQTQGSLLIHGGLNGQFYLEEMERGARGTMPGSDATRAFRRMHDAFHAGQREEAWRVFTAVLPLLRFELQPGLGVSAMKHNLVARGVIQSATVRHPTSSLDAAGLQELAWLRAWTDRGLAA
jgi:2-keto-3-deoxy-L-arabinonate dehydratase